MDVACLLGAALAAPAKRRPLHGALALLGLLGVLPDAASAIGVCPAENDPRCWNAAYICRRCCNLALSPRGDPSCWHGDVTYEACCAGLVQLRPFPTQHELLKCYDTATWLQAGRDPMAVDRATLMGVYQQSSACPGIQGVLHLALLAPIFQAGPSSQLIDQAYLEAEAVLQWFVDSLVTMLADLNTQGLAVFFVLHQIIAAVHREGGDPSRPRGSAVATSPDVARLGQDLRLGLPFDPGVTVAIFARVAAAAGSNASLGDVPARAPLPCSLEAALVLVAHADILRLKHGARSESFIGAVRAAQVCLDDVTRSGGLLVRQLMAEDAPPLLLALDRLECKPKVVVNLDADPFIESSAEALRGNFHISLLPVRDWESDFVRGYRDVHCGLPIRHLVQTRAALDPDGLFVDVGANIGGCSIWAARLLPELQVVAVEPLGKATEALIQTISWNGLADRVSVIQACVRSEGDTMQLRQVLPNSHSSWSRLQVRWELEERNASSTASGLSIEEAMSGKVVQCERLDILIQRRIAVLRVHTSGTEDNVLVSVAGLVQQDLLGAVALQFPSLSQARLLWGYGFRLEIAGQRIPRGDEGAFEAARQAGGYHGVLIGVSGEEV